MDTSGNRIASFFRSERPLYEHRLEAIQNQVPLDYNELVASYINLYVSRRKSMISRMLGLGEHYFPIFEQALKEKGMPTELKYLTVIESALNPHAVSRVGATGLWQFMYTTARMYGLQMDSYVDERKDPVAASRAAAEYLSDSYGRYGDWLLAIASYNCGTGNVDRAVHRAGGKLDFWAIRPYLPRETQDYVPKYIAAVYIMSYAPDYHITPQYASLTNDIALVEVNKRVSLSHLSESLQIEEEDLYRMNPQYKRRIVNGTGSTPKHLLIPSGKAGQFASLMDGSGQTPRVIAVSGHKPETLEYRVRQGDNLIAIANRYDCTVQDLKVWNELRSTRLVPGQKLLIYPEPEEEKASPAPAEAKTKAGGYTVYLVKKGDTLTRIAKRFGTTIQALKELNGLGNVQTLRIGMTLKL